MQAEAIVDRLLESGRPRRIVEAGVRSFLRDTVYGPAHRVAAHLKTLDLPLDIEQIALAKTKQTPIGKVAGAIFVALHIAEYRWIDGRRVLEPLGEPNRQKIDRAIKDFFVADAWRISVRWYVRPIMRSRHQCTRVDIYGWPKQQRYPAPAKQNLHIGDRVETVQGPARFGHFFGATRNEYGMPVVGVYWDGETSVDWLSPESIRSSTAPKPTSQG